MVALNFKSINDRGIEAHQIGSQMLFMIDLLCSIGLSSSENR